MPGRDRTGPSGGGPRTGWGFGSCGDPDDRTADPRGGGFGWGRGLGRGLGRFGRGMGFGRRFGWGRSRGADPGTYDEIDELRAESSRLRDELEAVSRRLSNLDKKG